MNAGLFGGGALSRFMRQFGQGGPAMAPPIAAAPMTQDPRVQTLGQPQGQQPMQPSAGVTVTAPRPYDGALAMERQAQAYSRPMANWAERFQILGAGLQQMGGRDGAIAQTLGAQDAKHRQAWTDTQSADRAKAAIEAVRGVIGREADANPIVMQVAKMARTPEEFLSWYAQWKPAQEERSFTQGLASRQVDLTERFGAEEVRQGDRRLDLTERGQTQDYTLGKGQLGVQQAELDLRRRAQQADEEERAAAMAAAAAPGASKPPTEGQAKFGITARRMADAEPHLGNLRPGPLVGVADSVPVVGDTLATWVRYGSPKAQQLHAAARQWGDSMVRLTSGAEAPPREVQSILQQYLPRADDSDQVIHQKQQARMAILADVNRLAGPGGSVDPNQMVALMQRYSPRANEGSSPSGPKSSDPMGLFK